ncbi:MAG: GNAT family N-acetyltransferase [Burkholderiales bacterium]|nr:GNAT family N-acetyltransferase [Anaerolineae bacterium]
MFRCPLPPDAELRLFQVRHAEDMFALITRNRERLDQWMRWTAKIQSVQDTEALIQRMLNKYANNDGFHAGICLNGQLVGGMACRGINWDARESEIGYWLTEEAVGHGLASRASRATLEYLFDELQLNRVEIRAAVDNTRSRAVAERIGFQLEGVLRQSDWITTKYVDHALYSILASDWRELKAEGRS